jgi:thiol-disulfide isomerase/thioredoxin
MHDQKSGVMRRRDKNIIVPSLICILFLSAFSLSAQDKHPARVVEPINVKGLERLIHDRNGKILFLNVWATWCQPCVEEFPDLIRLHQTYRDSAVDFVAISVDYPDEIKSKILPFLDTLRVPFKVYVSDIRKQEDFINALDPSWSGAIPATFIFDENGNRRAFLLGRKNFEIFKDAVDRGR